jgi:hypothetical protein
LVRFVFLLVLFEAEGGEEEPDLGSLADGGVYLCGAPPELPAKPPG